MLNFGKTLAIAMLLAAHPAIAADDEEKALLGLIGLEAAAGKTTVGDKAGQLESHILLASMLDDAGIEIAKQIIDKLSRKKFVVPLGENQLLDFRLYTQTQNRIMAIKSRLDAFPRNDGCDFARSRPGGVRPAAVPPNLIPQAIVGAIKTDTEVSGIDVEPGEQAVINAIVAQSIDPTKWLLPSEIAFGPDNSQLMSNVDDIVKKALPYSSGKCPNNKELTARATEIMAAVNILTTGGEKGAPSMLEAAVFLESTFLNGAKPEDIAVLRIGVEKAGGTLVNKSNIWTSLGFNGLTISGGLIVTFRLVDPKKGTSSISGSLVCTTPARSFKQINRHEMAKGKCVVVQSLTKGTN